MIANYRTIEECQTELDKQTKKMQPLLDQLEQGKIQKKSLESSIKQAEKKNDQLQTEFKDLQEKVAAYKAKVDRRDPQEMEKLQWYNETAAIIEKISGISVNSYEPGKSLTLSVKTIRPESLEYQVQMRFKGIKVLGVQISHPNLEVDGWMDSVISHYNQFNVPLHGFVAEITYQLEIFDARHAELGDLSKNYEISVHESDFHVLDFKGRNIQATVRVDSDYPMPGSKVQLIFFRGPSAKSVDCVKLMEEHKPITISDILMICELYQ